MRFLLPSCIFRYKAFKARKMLTAIDHNYYLHRQTKCTNTGETKFMRKYNQRTKHWDVVALKQNKDYSYISMLLAKIFEMRKKDMESMQDYMDMSLNDPRRIARTIAGSAPLTTRELVAKHKSRFGSRQKDTTNLGK